MKRNQSIFQTFDAKEFHSEEKIDELSKYFRNPVSCVVVAPDNRRYSVSLEQFKSLSYQELTDLVTG
ncbi:MAG: hypothetical protein WBL67_11420 [Nitrososphaeraceae archaeon]